MMRLFLDLNDLGTSAVKKLTTDPQLTPSRLSGFFDPNEIIWSHDSLACRAGFRKSSIFKLIINTIATEDRLTWTLDWIEAWYPFTDETDEITVVNSHESMAPEPHGSRLIDLIAWGGIIG